MTGYAFEVFKGRKGDRRRPADITPTVTFARSGLIVFNAPAAEIIGEHVEFLYAPDAIGFRPSTKEAPDSYRARINGRQRIVTATAFSRFTGHDRRESKTYPARIVDGVLVVDR